VIDWSARAQAAVTQGRGPAASAYLLALVHAAMYDAAVAAEGTEADYLPFKVTIDAAQPALPAAAVATAAYRVLRQRLPALEPALSVDYRAYMGALGEGVAADNGVAAGEQVAEAWLLLRSGDGFGNAVTYVQPPPGPGVWEPTAAGPVAELVMSQLMPYTLSAARQFRPPPPPRLDEAAYTTAFQEVSERGRATRSRRSDEQTEVALFWSEHPAVQLNRNLRRLAASERLNLTDTARMLAMVYVAGADALVGCFDAKFHFMFWRPLHAIQRAETDGNPDTAGDPGWTALLNVNHPEYPSAHACVTSALAETLWSYFGEDKSFAFDSAVTGHTRRYATFNELTNEVADARVFAGLHFRFSTDAGAVLGKQVSHFVTEHHFVPVHPRCAESTAVGGCDPDAMPQKSWPQMSQITQTRARHR
jgi:hypothetical protein